MKFRLLPFLLLPSLASAAEKIDFSRDVLPILSDNCFHCHGPDENARRGDLRLDTEAGAKTVLVSGKASDSELIRRLITEEKSEKMPPAKSNRKLTPQQISTLKQWVDSGAKWGQHWAFVPVQRPTSSRSFEVIDQYIEAKLKTAGLPFSPEATRETLIRRLTLDLTGLPPTLDEIDTFVKDRSTNAYEKLVDRLLASPRYGERMAWEWLDAARYADTNGYQGDGERTMWPWRDWVVRKLNEDMPFDRFTVEQIAGDLLPNASPEQKLATAFNRNHMINGEGGRIAEENRIEYVFDQTETVGTIWLGLTLNCCRCHDHKFDPLLQKDYYQLFAFFNQTPVNGGGGSGQTAPVLDFATPEQERRKTETAVAYNTAAKRLQEIETKLRLAGMVEKDGQQISTLPQVIESSLRKGPNDRVDGNFDELAKFYRDTQPEYVTLLSEVLRLRKVRDEASRGVPKVMVMEDLPKGRETFILERGSYEKKLAKVSADVPGSLPTLPQSVAKNRLALAQWLVSKDHPLTARVIVNRQWQLFFGTGLVKTTEDFGVQGERPTHPELLDWLAAEFVERNWSLKQLHKLILMSRTYRQSSKVTQESLKLDPENRLLSRGIRYRMPSWMLRDQALFTSGLLTVNLGGPSVSPYQPPGIWEEATFGNKQYRQDHGEALYRRSLYVFWRRIVGPTMFFDTANRQTCTVKTSRTNTPLHALTTLNDITYVEAARVLAQRVLEGKTDSPLDLAFRLATSRSPTEKERGILKSSFEKQKTLFTADPESAKKLLAIGESKRNDSLNLIDHAALTTVCLMILNLDETLNRP
jgi:hypothetical protein